MTVAAASRSGCSCYKDAEKMPRPAGSREQEGLLQAVRGERWEKSTTVKDDLTKLAT